MKKHHVLSEFLVLNDVIKPDQMILALEERKKLSHNLSLFERLQPLLSREDMELLENRSLEKNELLEEAVLALGLLSEKKVNEMKIEKDWHSVPLDQVLLSRGLISREELNQWLENFQNQEFDISELVAFLKETPLFAKLSQSQLEKVAPLLKFHFFPSGDAPYNIGSESRCVYFIASGMIQLVVESALRQLELVRLIPGDYFGLYGVLSGHPNNERAVAVLDTCLWSLDKDALKGLLKEIPELAITAAEHVSLNIQFMQKGLRKPSPKVLSGNINCVIIPPDSYRDDVATTIIDEMYNECQGPVLLIKSIRLPKWGDLQTVLPGYIGKTEPSVLIKNDLETAGGERVIHCYYYPHIEDMKGQDMEDFFLWIRTRAKQYNQVVFLLGPKNVEFRTNVMGISRHSIIFTSCDIFDLVDHCRKNRDWVYLVDNGEKPDKIYDSYSELKKRCYHALSPVTFKMKDLQHYSRLIARRLVAHTVGLALGGGGARGMAQIGLLEMLEEEGITIDALAGASAGAINAGLIAYGYDSKDLVKMYVDETIKKKSNPFSDWTIPLKSFSKGKKAKKLLLKYFKDTLVYDVKLPYFPVAVDMADGREVHMKGCELWRGILASGAAPPIMPMVEYDGMTLVDGGLVNNVPASVLKDFGIDTVISVNISVAPEKSPFTASNIVNICLRSIDIMMDQTVEKHLEYTDLEIEPEIDKYGVLDYPEGYRIMDLGREAAKRKRVELRYLLGKTD